MSALGFPAPGWHQPVRQMPPMRTWQPRPVYRQVAPSFDRGAWQRANDNHRRANDYYLDRQRYAQRMALLAQQQGTAQAQAAAAAAQQQLLTAQQALATTQAQVAAQQPAPGAVVTAPPPSPIVSQPSMPEPQPDVSPGNANVDTGPTQDAAAAASAGPMEEHPGHAMGRKVVFGVVIVGLGVGAYMFMKHKKKGGGAAKPHSMHGARRRRFRRR